MAELVFDIETQTADFGFDEQGLKRARVSVVGVYDYADGSYKTFMEDELTALFALMEQADRLISYNGIHFDIPVLNNYYSGNLSKIPHLDLIVPVREALGFRLKLNDLARSTLHEEKSADGLQAVKWWAEGKVEEIKKYCLQDVKVTKNLYEFGKEQRQLMYQNLQGKTIAFPVNFTHAAGGTASAAPGINRTLPL